MFQSLRPSGWRIGVLVASLLWAGALSLGVVSCGGDSPQGGVISTGNAGRIRGVVGRSSDSTSGIPGASVVVERLEEGRWIPVDSLQSDPEGAFAFGGLPEGTYRVSASDGVGGKGSSGEFVLGGEDVQLVVVLVAITRVRLAFAVAPPSQVEAVRIQGWNTSARRSGDAWIVDLATGRADTLVAVVRREGGSATEISYLLEWADGDIFLHPLDQGAPTGTGSELEGLRLLADWTFDASGTLLDHSGQGNHGTAHGDITRENGTWTLDGVGAYISLGECIRDAGACADWSRSDLTIQLRFRLPPQTLDPLAHLWTLRSFNGEIMLKRLSGDTLGLGTASSEGFAGFGIPWRSRLDVWANLVAIRRVATDSVEVWVDGQRAGAFYAPGAWHTGAGIPPQIGAYLPTQGRGLYAAMSLDRMRIWSGALQADQVEALQSGL
ncbi:MAG: carboxypeptidase regulatory-like domain-containing protein [Fibrobacteria bacterium]|nr:carboxypeptidase regulatory-like domain-containing protein [Fibrobacteria bacterium]